MSGASTNLVKIEEIIQRLNILLPQHYNIIIQPSPLGMAGGAEEYSRLLSGLLIQSYSFLDWPFPSISEEALTQLIQLF